MVAIVKVNFDWKGSKRLAVVDAKLIWIYNTKDESYHKGSKITEGSLDFKGYKIIGFNKEFEEFAIDLGYSGEKDAIWTSIQNSLKPLIRERVINDLFLQVNS